MTRMPALIAALCLMAAAPAWSGEAAQRGLGRIDWKAAGQARAAAPAGAATQPALDQVRLPVLLLPAEGEWGAPRFVGQGNAYAALYAPPKANLSLFGAASRIIAPAGLKLEHAPGAFESIGDGADYSFTRFGAAYTLRITCDEPLKDKRCTEPQYLTDAASALVMGGGRAQ